MSNYTFQVGQNERVLVLEDNEERAAQFREWIPTATLVKTRDEADAVLQRWFFHHVFLDFDLGPITYQDGEFVIAAGTGADVAHILKSRGHTGRNVVIHSHNAHGARDMKRLLPHAQLLPFGTFRVEVVT